MRAKEQIKQLFSTLTKAERENLLEELSSCPETKVGFAGEAHICPHCNSKHFNKNGTHKGEQRYLCCHCHRTFSIVTGTALNHIKKKSFFEKYKKMLIEEGYMPIREIAKRVGVSIPTAMAWRHKILLSLPESNEKFKGETELDDIWMLYSQKGRKGLQFGRKRGGSKRKGDNDFQAKLLVAANKGHTEMKMVRIGRITTADIERGMGEKFSKETSLISDKHHSILGFTKQRGIGHVRVKAKEHTNHEGKGPQLVNNLAGRLDTLVNRNLRGVSTKYLQLYARWFSFNENNKNNKDKLAAVDKAILADKSVWDVYSNVEKLYENFILRFSKRTYRCPVKKTYKANNWNQSAAAQFAYI